MESVSGMVVGVFVLIANVLGAGMIVPQLVRLRRRGATAGLSPTWIGIGLTMNLWWVGYCTSQSLWGMLPVSVVAAVLYVLIAIEFQRLDGPMSVRLIVRGALAIAVVPLLFLIVGGWPAAGLAIGLIYAIQFAPATLAALQSEDLSGVAASTWVMALGEALIWFAYGWSRGDIALTIGGAGGATLSALILLRVAYLAHRRAPVVPHRRRLDVGDDPDAPLLRTPAGAGPRPS